MTSENKCIIDSCNNDRDNNKYNYCLEHYRIHIIHGNATTKVCKMPGCCVSPKKGEYCAKHKNAKYSNLIANKCKVKSCNSKEFKNGYCGKHNERYEKYGDATYVIPLCKSEYCSVKAHKDGYCAYHYNQSKRKRKHMSESKKIFLDNNSTLNTIKLLQTNTYKHIMTTTCKTHGCNRVAIKDGLCYKHQNIHSEHCKIDGCKNKTISIIYVLNIIK